MAMAALSAVDNSTSMVNGLQAAVTGAGLPEMTAAVRELCKAGVTPFAETLLMLLEVTVQLTELDGTSQEASTGYDGESAEARKWREISATTLQFCRDGLVEQQLRAIEKLQELSARGGSLVMTPGQPSLDGTAKSCAGFDASEQASPAKPKEVAIASPPGLSRELLLSHRLACRAELKAKDARVESLSLRGVAALSSLSPAVSEFRPGREAAPKPTLSAAAAEFRPAAAEPAPAVLNLGAFEDSDDE